MNTNTVDALKNFLTDDQIIEIAEFSTKNRHLEAARLLQYFLLEKWSLTTLEAVAISRKLSLEFSEV